MIKIRKKTIPTDLNQAIIETIVKAKLDRHQNNFFRAANLCESISLESAYNIAFNWRDITKQFLFTTIRGLSAIVNCKNNLLDQNDNALWVLQTAFSVISDDLNNAYSIFKNVAPLGPAGIHYRWWEDSILSPIEKLVPIKINLSSKTQQLLKKMDELSNDFMGTPTQLRVVEAIALDIALAFFSIFEKLEHNGEKIFKNKEDMAWIISHIEAESVHHHKVCNELSGMCKIAQTDLQKSHLLELTKEYCVAWSETLDDFAEFILP